MDKSLKVLASIFIIPIIIFIYVTGGFVLFTENTNWILDTYSIDYKQHWITWLFFQDAPLMQIPITDNFNYGMTNSTTLSVNDSIPIMALIFKLIKPIFNLPSQYFGLWIFISICLQFFFSFKILKIFIKDNYLTVIFSIFFIISPILLHRLSLGHTAMFAHWLILAGFYLYFLESKKIYFWLIIIFVSLLVNSYIASMVLLIFIGNFYKIISKKRDKIRIRQYLVFLLTIFAFFGSLPLIGLDINVSDYYKGGFGNYRFNLASFFDPVATNWYHINSWSILLPDLQGEKNPLSGDYEGFAFLGIAVITLLPFCIIYGLKNYSKKINLEYLPLIFIAIICFIYSLSNSIIFGEHNLFEYNVPNIIDSYTHSLRASGRFIWPTYYLLYFLIFIISYKFINNKVLRILLPVLLLIQLYDSSNAIKTIRNTFISSSEVVKPEWKHFMKDPAWIEISKKYKNVRIVMPNGFPSKQYFPISLFAARNSMKIDSGYHARFDINKMEEYQSLIEERLKKNLLSDTDIYFFVKYDNQNLDLRAENIWKIINQNKGVNDFSGEIDGFRIFAPNFFLK